MKFVDLSVSIIHNAKGEVELGKPKIQYFDHKGSVEGMLEFFPGTKAEDLPNENAWAFEIITLQTHSGTHIDAPYHYGPKMNSGERSRTIDEMPLDWFYGDGVVLDFSSHAPDKVLTSEDYQRELDRIGYTLKPGDIVFVRSGAAAFWGSEEYLVQGAGTGREATLWLIEQGIRLVGTDAWSWDRPLSLTAEEFRNTHNKELIWEGHFAGLEKEYCHIEKLTNLEMLPPYGFRVACFPIKIEAASGGWSRVVAMLED